MKKISGLIRVIIVFPLFILLDKSSGHQNNSTGKLLGHRMRGYLLYSLILLFVVLSCKKNEDVHLTLPPRIYCSPFAEVSIYYKNLIQTDNPNDYTFKISPKLGTDNTIKYTFDIDEKASKNFKMNVDVFNKKGKKVAGGTTEVVYTVPKSFPADTIQILITGNSLTNAGYFAAKVKSLCLTQPQLHVNFLGTKESNGGIHEGYRGKTWEWFSQNIESPFVFNFPGNDTTLSFKNYFENVVHHKPDFVVIELGINDCFRADTTSVGTIDLTIDSMLVHTGYYLNKLIDYKNNIKIGICLPPSANTNNTGFVASYGDKYTQTGWTKIQRRLVQRYIDYFDDNFKSNCKVIPLEVNFDTENGYPVDNGVHPNKLGYNQIASSIFNWLLYEIENIE